MANDPGKVPPNPDDPPKNPPADPPADPPKDPPADPPADPSKVPPADTPKDPGKVAPGQQQGVAPDFEKLTVPDQGKGVLDDEDLARVKEVAKANGWTLEDAQAEVNDQIRLTLEKQERQAEAWKRDLAGDIELGGDKLEDTQKMSKLGIDALFPEGHPRRDSFLSLLQRGIGNHPTVVYALRQVGKMVREDAPRPGGPGGPEKSAADILYDNPSSQPKQ